jgi:hypothetical protein
MPLSIAPSATRPRRNTVVDLHYEVLVVEGVERRREMSAAACP